MMGGKVAKFQTDIGIEIGSPWTSMPIFQGITHASDGLLVSTVYTLFIFFNFFFKYIQSNAVQ